MPPHKYKICADSWLSSHSLTRHATDSVLYGSDVDGIANSPPMVTISLQRQCARRNHKCHFAASIKFAGDDTTCIADKPEARNTAMATTFHSRFGVTITS